MVIVNKTNLDVECIVDAESFLLQANETIQVSDPHNIELKHYDSSYVCDGNEKSAILKVLSCLDDPFKTKKDYHICVNVMYDVSCYPPDANFIISHQSIFADVTLQVFYDYFILSVGYKILRPNTISIVEKDGISRLFEVNNRKSARWNAIWNILIEPTLFELIGYIVIYLLFLQWIGNKAWWIVAALFFVNILIEVVIFVLKDKTRDIVQFRLLLLDKTVIDKCYSITD